MLDTDSFKKAFLSELDKAASTVELQQVRIKYLGKKGLLTAQLKTFLRCLLKKNGLLEKW